MGRGHIPGSISTPYHDIRSVPEGLDPARPIAVICSSGERSGVAASLLVRHGARQVLHVVDGGVGTWAARGWPVEVTGPRASRAPFRGTRGRRTRGAGLSFPSVAEVDLNVVCKNCGSEVSPYITECPYCGQRLRKRAPKLRQEGEAVELAPEPQRRRRLRRARKPGHRRTARCPGSPRSGPT